MERILRGVLKYRKTLKPHMVKQLDQVTKNYI